MKDCNEQSHTRNGFESNNSSSVKKESKSKLNGKLSSQKKKRKKTMNDLSMKNVVEKLSRQGQLQLPP